MRGLALALALAFALGGCAAPAPKPAPGVGYNRRELPPSRGLLTGPDGVWTLSLDEREEAGGGPASEAPARGTEPP
jgi:hypothetical protein